jgi:hypothetical protein
MRTPRLITGLVVLGTVLTGSLAAQQSQAPKDATGQCTDSSYTTAKTQARACLKHGGVKTWFGGTASATAAPATTATAAPKASTPAPTKTTASKSPPKDATGECTDGSYTTAKTQARGCLKHGGVKTWFGAEAPTAAAAAPGAAAAAPAAAASPASGPTIVKTVAPRAQASAPGTTPAQAPANPTDVWVNLSTKAYHCPGTKYYGTTKHGKYMSEADAKAAGFHPSYGKACS